MSMELCVLGSGSSGNSTLVRLPGGSLLIDAGFGPRALAGRLARCAASLDEVRALLITHADRDHFAATWFNTLRRRRLPLYVHRRHRHGMCRTLRGAGPAADPNQLHRDGLLHWFDDQPFRLPLGSAGSSDPLVRPLHLAHDVAGTTGFRIESAGHALGFATDLGRATESLIEAFTDTHLLALESNYDPAMQIASPRPALLKRRIMNGRGHLSNIEALNALREIFKRSARPPRHVVLLHLSRQCNDPRIVRRTFAAEPHISRRLCLTCQQHPTDWLSADGPFPRPATRPRHLFA